MGKYRRTIGDREVDPYIVGRAYEITDPAIFHAFKKIMRYGRGTKGLVQDITEARDALDRFLELEAEAERNAQALAATFGSAAYLTEKEGEALIDTIKDRY